MLSHFHGIHLIQSNKKTWNLNEICTFPTFVYTRYLPISENMGDLEFKRVHCITWCKGGWLTTVLVVEAVSPHVVEELFTDKALESWADESAGDEPLKQS